MNEEQNLPDLAWVRGISRLDDERLRANLRGLSVDEQAELVLSAGWQDRLRLIRNMDQAADVVKALPREEVFLTIKSLDEEDALTLVALTSPSQLRFILDVELWKKDDIDEAKVLAWLGRLLAAGESKIIEFVTTVDMELLAIILRKLVYLLPNEEGVVIPEGLPSIMADEFFTILSNYPEDTENIGLFLRIVRQADQDLFYTMLCAAHGMEEAETQEEAFRWRTSRLEESGFLDFDEAVEIYGYLSEDESRRVASTSPHLYYAADEAAPAAPTFPVLLADRKNFFYEVLVSVEERALRNRLRHEIAFSANRLLVADADHLGEIASIKKAVERLFSLVNVGLLFLAEGDKAAAARVLADVPLREIFQIGFSRVADLRTSGAELARRYWPEWAARGFGFLEYDQAEMMKGLMMRVPQHYGVEGDSLGFRDFGTMDEVRVARRALGEIGAAARACFDTIGIPRPHEAKATLTDVFALGLEDITLGNLMLTGFVNLILRGEFDIAPLAPGDVAGLLDRVMQAGAAGRRVRPQHLERLLGWLAGKTGFDTSEMEALGGFVRARVTELEQEVGGITAAADLDPRYVRTLLFAKQGHIPFSAGNGTSGLPIGGGL
jgi:hypothetical protein